MTRKFTRRQFVRQTASAGAAFPLFLPGLSLADPPSGKLNHAAIGVGGMMGLPDLQAIGSSPNAHIAAICDVDENHLNAAAEKFPGARKYSDWREMLEKEGDRIDSVNVTTADHMHAPITMSAMNRGKHVYCQKPLTHSVHEARQIALTAKRNNLVTQMGIQIHSHFFYRKTVAMIQSGVIGKVHEFHSWHLDIPACPQSIPRPKGEDRIPPEVNWDLWLGVAPHRPFKKEVYHPFNWRGWVDFGGGGVGDMACHIFDPVFTALELGAPRRIRSRVPKQWLDSSQINTETWPKWEIVEYEFPGTRWTAGETLRGIWYDGGKQPPPEVAPLEEGKELPSGGTLFIGEEGVLMLPHVKAPELLPAERFKGYQAPKTKHHDHYHQWVDACLGKDQTSAPFSYAGPLTETVLLANVAARFPQALEWDALALKVTNLPEANHYLRTPYRDGWVVEGLG